MQVSLLLVHMHVSMSVLLPLFVVSVLMIVTFAFALSQLGLDGGELVLGLLPSKPPRGAGIVAVSMVATSRPVSTSATSIACS